MSERGELEPIEPSSSAARALLTDARRSLATCRAIADTDPKSGLLLAWDGVAFPLLSAALNLAGYRVTNRMGHHRVAVTAGRQLLSADPLLSRISAIRRARDRTMYENDPPPPEELRDVLDDCEELADLMEKALQRTP
jgi:hypothetical protein